MLIGMYRIVDLPFRSSEGTGNKRSTSHYLLPKVIYFTYFVSSLMLAEGIFSTSSPRSFSLISYRVITTFDPRFFKKIFRQEVSSLLRWLTKVFIHLFLSYLHALGRRVLFLLLITSIWRGLADPDMGKNLGNFI